MYILLAVMLLGNGEYQLLQSSKSMTKNQCVELASRAPVDIVFQKCVKITSGGRRVPA